MKAICAFNREGQSYACIFDTQDIDPEDLAFQLNSAKTSNASIEHIDDCLYVVPWSDIDRILNDIISGAIPTHRVKGRNDESNS